MALNASFETLNSFELPKVLEVNPLFLKIL